MKNSRTPARVISNESRANDRIGGRAPLSHRAFAMNIKCRAAIVLSVQRAALAKGRRSSCAIAARALSLGLPISRLDNELARAHVRVITKTHAHVTRVRGSFDESLPPLLLLLHLQHFFADVAAADWPEFFGDNWTAAGESLFTLARRVRRAYWERGSFASFWWAIFIKRVHNIYVTRGRSRSSWRSARAVIEFFMQFLNNHSLKLTDFPVG